jgi:hypothetical protein
MRTTLDLPDPVFRKLKARAALEGLSLKDLIARYVANGLRVSEPDPAGRVAETAPAEAEKFVSAYEAMKDGCGIARSGHRDLATSPKHMEGFGRD